MLSVNILFVFLASLVFLGFILNSLFSKIKIASIVPLMLIGLLIGPVFKFVQTTPNSIIIQLSPFITAVAVSFILFDVGLNINFFKLKQVLTSALKFTFIVAIITGIICSAVAMFISSFIFHWNLITVLIFGFAIAGPSTIVVPVVLKVTNFSEELKTILLFEAISVDILTLIVPLILSHFLCANTVCTITTNQIVTLIFNNIINSIIIAIAISLFWLFILNKFKEYSKDYMWMLTMTMVLATYGFSEIIGLNGAIVVFVFGLMLANIDNVLNSSSAMYRYFSISVNIEHIRSYQKEIVFFVSTFFFLYIGLLFHIPTSETMIIIMVTAGILFSFLFFGIRYLMSPLLAKYLSKNKDANAVEKSFVNFDIARGLSPAIIATIPISLGLTIPGFVDQIFFIILISNIFSSIGIFFTYNSKKLAPLQSKPIAQQNPSGMQFSSSK